MERDIDCTYENYRKRNKRQKKESTPPPLPILFSVYVATSKLCRDILCENKISAIQDNQEDIVNEMDKYVVLFYGKPIFLSKNRQNSNLVVCNTCLPCCLVLDTEKITPRHIYPFDPHVCPPQWHISDFELKSLPAVLEHIKRYFGNNHNYVTGRYMWDSRPVKDMEENEMRSLIGNIENLDEKKTVEFFCDEIELSTAIKAIIVPKSLSENVQCKRYLNKLKQHLKVKIFKYEDHYPKIPSDFNETLYQELIKFHHKMHRFDYTQHR